MTCKCFSFVNRTSTSYSHFEIYYVYYSCKVFKSYFLTKSQDKIQDLVKILSLLAFFISVI